MTDFEHVLQVALALALMFVAGRHLHLVRRHERAKACLARVRSERDEARQQLWQAAQADQPRG